MIDFAEFERLVRDALANLYDYAYLETHLLNNFIANPPEAKRADHLRSVLLNAIEAFCPGCEKNDASDENQRIYLVLRSRFVENLNQTEMQNRLALGERQLRRLQSRYVHALATILWDQVFQEASEASVERNNLFAYVAQSGPIDVPDLIQGVIEIFKKRSDTDDLQFICQVKADLPELKSDRVILRQILIGLVNVASGFSECGKIFLSADLVGYSLDLRVSFFLDEASSFIQLQKQPFFESTGYWVRQLGASLRVTQAGEGSGRKVDLVIRLPHDREAVIFVVEDQATAIRLYERYLQRYQYRVLGIQDPRQVIAMAKRDKPRAILLDIMMPNVDGWEVLQAIKADPDVLQIPVIVCSAWGDASLALSLGASAFLKKPISPQVLLEALQRLFQ
jgi:CheY-like chemotaxis protein